MLSIPRKEANLFVKSEVSRKYPWLVSAIVENHSFPNLSQNEFKKLSQEQQEFLNLKWGELFGLAQDEWKVTSKFKKNENGFPIDCELCGHKELDLISEIENMENGNKLIVGSTCIEKFDKIKNNSLVDYKKYQKDKKMKEKIVSNEEYIEEKINGILKIIREFKKVQNDDSIILNKELVADYKRILGIIEDDYVEQLKLSQSKIDMKIIKSTYLTTKEFMKKLDVYKERCRAKVWGITPEIARWCHKNGSLKLLKLLQNFGEINKYTVDQIKEENHLNNVVIYFEDLLKVNNIKLIKNSKNVFSVIVNIRNNIVLCVDTIAFLKIKKEYLFDGKKSKIEISELLEISKISSQSYDNATRYICRHENFKDYYKYYYADISLNEIAFVDKKSKKIYVLDYKLFIQNFKYYIYEKRIDITKNSKLLNYIKENSTRYEESDYKYHLRQLGVLLNI